MTIEYVSMEKCWNYFNPPKPEEKNKEVGLSVFTLQKFPIVSKNKKTTQKLFE